MTEPPIPPEPPPPTEMTLRPPGEFRREQYDTDAALELFENLLLAAARIPVEDYPATHPLVLVQAAKALVGLRPHEPSRRLIDFALDRCPELPPERPVDDLKIPLERLGTTVAVFELEDAVESGDLPAAREQLGRLLLVSDNKPFAFDILLDLAARQTDKAPALVPLVHYCLRAAQFVGPGHVADFLLPALDALVAGRGSSSGSGSGSRQLAVGSRSLPGVEQPRRVGSSGGRGSTGDRGWLLEEIEQASEITIGLLLWADNFRMLYRTAGEEHYPLLKELAETRLAGLANEK